jgi:hypothetical protein
LAQRSSRCTLLTAATATNSRHFAEFGIPQEGYRTEVVTVTVTSGKDIAGYDATEDVDLYEYYLADEWQEL